MSESTMLWSELVNSVETDEEDKTAYEFSNGRKFESGDGAYAVD